MVFNSSQAAAETAMAPVLAYLSANPATYAVEQSAFFSAPSYKAWVSSSERRVSGWRLS